MALRDFIGFMLPATILATTKLQYYNSPSCLIESEIGDHSCNFFPWDVQPCQHAPLNTFGMTANKIRKGCTIMTYSDQSCTVELGPISRPDTCFSSTSSRAPRPILVVNSDKSNAGADEEQHEQQQHIGSWQVICNSNIDIESEYPSPNGPLERKHKRQENNDDDGYMYTEGVATASTSSPGSTTLSPSAGALTDTSVSTTAGPVLSETLPITSSSTSTWWCSGRDATAATDITPDSSISSTGTLATWLTTTTTTGGSSNGSGNNATVSMGRPSASTNTHGGNNLTSTGGAAAAAAVPAGDFVAGKGGKVEMLAALVVLGAAMMM